MRRGRLIGRRGRKDRLARKGAARAAFVALAVAAALMAALLFLPGAAAAQQGGQQGRLPAQMARAEGWWLQVKNAAVAAGPTVLLGDIAEPRGDLSASGWKELAARPLWPAPEKTGHQTALTRERLQAMLRHYLPGEAEACVLPQQIIVQRGGGVQDEESLRRLVVAFLTERSRDLGGELDITDLHIPEYVFYQGQRDKLDLVMNGAAKPGRVNLIIEVKGADGKVSRRFAASAFLNVWRAVACAARPLNRLEVVSPDRVVFKRKNLAYYPTAWDGSGGPWRMTRSLGAEQVIGADAIEPVPVIAKGAKINLLFEGPSIRLSVKAEALADGGVGQLIQVRNLQSNRKVLATVLDESTVVVR